MRHLPFHLLLLLALCQVRPGTAADAPVILAHRAGDLSVTLHWRPSASAAGYQVYRSSSPDGPFLPAARLKPGEPRWCDFDVQNGSIYFFQVRTLAADAQEGPPSAPVAVTPRPFESDDAFLEFIQQAHFDFFWFAANPTNGLVPDRSSPGSPCSIAAVGFGLTAILIGIDHGWITRDEGLQRVRTTLNTFWTLPQGPDPAATIGYRGWFYHFLDMQTGLRFTRFNTELSSIDTALFLGGVLDAKQYFDRNNPAEREIRRLATAIFDRVDWRWMLRDSGALSMGWMPDKGFLKSEWVGYNEAMILYVMGIGAERRPLPASAWSRWTRGYAWRSHYGQEYLPFPPLFGHQYSHCWVDFRHITDEYLRSRGITYYENSRRATLAQQAYCIANPAGHQGYSATLWGLTACDGPAGYSARGAPPPEHDDGTIAPTAAGGSVPFAPEICIPTLRHFYHQFRTQIWTPLGFRDAFNLGKNWWGPDTLGIDQGPILIMIENHRTRKVWDRFMKNPEIQRGLQRAGFRPATKTPPATR